MTDQAEVQAAHDRLVTAWRFGFGTLVLSAADLYWLHGYIWAGLDAVEADLSLVTLDSIQQALAPDYSSVKVSVECWRKNGGNILRAIVPALGFDGQQCLERSLRCPVIHYRELPDPPSRSRPILGVVQPDVPPSPEPEKVARPAAAKPGMVELQAFLDNPFVNLGLWD